MHIWEVYGIPWDPAKLPWEGYGTKPQSHGSPTLGNGTAAWSHGHPMARSIPTLASLGRLEDYISNVEFWSSQS